MREDWADWAGAGWSSPDVEEIGLSTFTVGFSAEPGPFTLVLLVGEDQLSLELKLNDLSRLTFLFFPELSFGSFKLRLCLLFSCFFSPSGGLELSREIFCLKMAPTKLEFAFTSLAFGTSSSELSGGDTFFVIFVFEDSMSKSESESQDRMVSLLLNLEGLSPGFSEDFRVFSSRFFSFFLSLLFSFFEFANSQVLGTHYLI